MKDWLRDYECSCGATYDVEVELTLEDESLVVTSINPKRCPACGKGFYAYAEYSVFLEETDDEDEDEVDVVMQDAWGPDLAQFCTEAGTERCEDCPNYDVCYLEDEDALDR